MRIDYMASHDTIECGTWVTFYGEQYYVEEINARYVVLSCATKKEFLSTTQFFQLLDEGGACIV